MKYVLDACMMKEREATHLYLQHELALPDYYGQNLDALYDCLTDFSETVIVIKNYEKAEGYFDLVYKVMMHASVENTDLHIILEN